MLGNYFRGLIHGLVLATIVLVVVGLWPGGETEPPIEKTDYWITWSSDVRHNRSCPWFEKSSGRYGAAEDGTPCEKCGG